MITGDIKSQVDAVWDHLWTNGLSNPLDAIEQVTFLLFLKRLDEDEVAREARSRRTGEPFASVFPPDADGQSCRWSKFK